MAELTAELQTEIEDMGYVDMLRVWRHSPIGSNPKLLEGISGDYFSKIMFHKKDQLTHNERVAASKQVGWGHHPKTLPTCQ